MNNGAVGTTNDVAEYLKVPPKTLVMWRYKGIGPRYARVGRHIRYRWADVEKWLTAQTAAAKTG